MNNGSVCIRGAPGLLFTVEEGDMSGLLDDTMEAASVDSSVASRMRDEGPATTGIGETISGDPELDGKVDDLRGTCRLCLLLGLSLTSFSVE